MNIPFKIAKILKEKGFDKSVNKFYQHCGQLTDTMSEYAILSDYEKPIHH